MHFATLTVTILTERNLGTALDQDITTELAAHCTILRILMHGIRIDWTIGSPIHADAEARGCLAPRPVCGT